MKKCFKFSFFAIELLLLLFITAITVNSQTAGQDSSSAAQIFNTLAGINLSTLFSSLGALCSAVLILTSLLKKLFNANGTITIIISGVVSIVLSLFGCVMGIGIYSGLSLIYVIIYGAAAMLIANGLSTWGVVSGILTFFKLKVPEEK